ncbi:MAG: alpha-galactosidase [Coriobacteriia bacterium]|nr:alpha-galactosidase [Coriobacteriia bacterium]
MVEMEQAFWSHPSRYQVKYRAVSDGGDIGPLCTLVLENCPTYVTQDLSILARFDGEVLSFEVTPLVPVRLEAFEVQVEHEFDRMERVLLNGYQSWSTTEWLSAFAGMRGIDHVPQQVKDRYFIGQLGDYQFTDYGGGRSRQHGYSYAVLRRQDVYRLVGSLNERTGFTRLRSDAQAGMVTLQRECPNRVLQPGETLRLLQVALLAGTEDAVYDRWFELAGIAARPVRPLVGYSSWYRHYGDIDHAKLESDLEGAQTAFSGVDTEGATRLFQIDDGFSKVGDWLDVDRVKFPEGLASLAGRIREAGFLPGLWLAPFVCEKESRLAAEHPDWLLRDAAGEAVRAGFHWSGSYALDTLNPEVRAYVRDVLHTVVREWGFGLLKLDFLYAACLEPHGGLNRGELMADGMQLLREAAGEDCLLDGCGVPLGSAFGAVDYCRIGCDVGLDWDDKPHMRLLHRERISTKNSMGNTISRAPLDGRAFGNDPDVFFLRDDVQLTVKQRRTLLENDARYGSMLLTSDDMGAWGAAERDLFATAIRTLLARRG